MRRRDVVVLLGGGAVAWPRASRSQQKAMPVIGYLTYFESRRDAPGLVAFRTGLGELGYIEGQNLMIDYRGAGGHVHLLSELAADLVARQVDVTVTAGGPTPARAAKNKTSSIPIVFITGSDPVEDGLVASLGRPANNLTGMTFISTELNPKRLELLSELVPRSQLVGLLVTGVTRPQIWNKQHVRKILNSSSSKFAQSAKSTPLLQHSLGCMPTRSSSPTPQCLVFDANRS